MMDMSAMKAMQAALLPDQGSIWRRSVAADGMGGQSETWTEILSNTSCRVGNIRGEWERVVAARVSHGSVCVVTLLAGMPVQPDDRIVVPGKPLDGRPEKTYIVMGVGQGSFGTATRCVCVEAA